MNVDAFSDPILSCSAAQAFEAAHLTSEAAEWSAMQLAGGAVARAALRDYRELRAVPDRLRVLVLVGKGHNGGDALIACSEILAHAPRAQVQIWLAGPADQLKPLAARAFEDLSERVKVETISEEASTESLVIALESQCDGDGFHLCIDGLMGMGFRPPLRAPMRAMIEAVNGFEKIDLRAAVDLPSGLGSESDRTVFQADFTYATGIVKQPVFDVAEAGRVRYLEIGFFKADNLPDATERVTSERVLSPFRSLRSGNSDKRDFGHLFIIGGSVSMPGALLMSVQAAVRSGVGRVTVFAPESIVPALSAQVPEAMWIRCPETSQGLLRADTFIQLERLIERATAVMIGPGMGQDMEVASLLKRIGSRLSVPMVLDADALIPEFVCRLKSVDSQKCRVIVTPHRGEFMRIAKLSESQINNETLKQFSASNRLCTVLKDRHTRISDGQVVLRNTSGGPILARGGSGDILAGLLGGLLARPGSDALEVAAQGVYLHGLAADAWARDKGAHFVRTTELLEYLTTPSLFKF